ncbi:MAG TPA: hypothetical protein VGH16_05955 [Candidatus Binatia bacterium]|jgi:hypothetical protein
MRKSLRIAECFILLFGLLWCEAIKAEPFPGPAEIKAMQIGEDYVAANFKFFTVRNETPKLEDKGKYWLFYYALPPDMIGGSPHR